MLYRVRRSFVDPFTGRTYLRGKSYLVSDVQHADYLERHGLIEKAPVEQSAGANASGKQPKRRKRGDSRGPD